MEIAQLNMLIEEITEKEESAEEIRGCNDNRGRVMQIRPRAEEAIGRGDQWRGWAAPNQTEAE